MARYFHNEGDWNMKNMLFVMRDVCLSLQMQLHDKPWTNSWPQLHPHCSRRPSSASANHRNQRLLLQCWEDNTQVMSGLHHFGENMKLYGAPTHINCVCSAHNPNWTRNCSGVQKGFSTSLRSHDHLFCCHERWYQQSHLYSYIHDGVSAFSRRKILSAVQLYMGVLKINRSLDW